MIKELKSALSGAVESAAIVAAIFYLCWASCPDPVETLTRPDKLRW